MAPPRRGVSAGGHLCGAGPQGRETGRPAGHAIDQVRAGHQPQNRQGTRPRRAADAARPRRRGDRIKHGRTSFAALHESVRGTNATSTNVAFEPLIGRDRTSIRRAEIDAIDPDRKSRMKPPWPLRANSDSSSKCHNTHRLLGCQSHRIRCQRCPIAT
jgi:hypothetical protein